MVRSLSPGSSQEIVFYYLFGVIRQSHFNSSMPRPVFATADVEPTVCLMCCGQYPYGCTRTCPSKNGYSLGALTTRLESGIIVPGIVPYSSLLWEVCNRAKFKVMALKYARDRRIQELAVHQEVSMPPAAEGYVRRVSLSPPIGGPLATESSRGPCYSRTFGWLPPPPPNHPPPPTTQATAWQEVAERQAREHREDQMLDLQNIQGHLANAERVLWHLQNHMGVFDGEPLAPPTH